VAQALDYVAINSIAANDADRFVSLRPASFYVLMAALEAVAYRGQWENNGQPLSDMQWDTVEAWVDGAADDIMGGKMLGMICPFCRVDTLPPCFLLCDGSEYDAADYPALFAVLPASLKGSTTFNVPDLTDKFIYGADASDVGVEGGENQHMLTTDEIPSHNHGLYLTGDLDVEGVGVPQPNAAQLSPVITLYTASTGGGDPHENRPAFFSVVYGIAAC
jgi:microcystin-dependent protein